MSNRSDEKEDRIIIQAGPNTISTTPAMARTEVGGPARRLREAKPQIRDTNERLKTAFDKN